MSARRNAAPGRKQGEPLGKRIPKTESMWRFAFKRWPTIPDVAVPHLGGVDWAAPAVKEKTEADRETVDGLIKRDHLSGKRNNSEVSNIGARLQ
jgi:hypothetical protein